MILSIFRFYRWDRSQVQIAVGIQARIQQVVERRLVWNVFQRDWIYTLETLETTKKIMNAVFKEDQSGVELAGKRSKFFMNLSKDLGKDSKGVVGHWTKVREHLEEKKAKNHKMGHQYRLYWEKLQCKVRS